MRTKSKNRSFKDYKSLPIDKLLSIFHKSEKVNKN